MNMMNQFGTDILFNDENLIFNLLHKISNLCCLAHLLAATLWEKIPVKEICHHLIQVVNTLIIPLNSLNYSH